MHDFVREVFRCGAKNAALRVFYGSTRVIKLFDRVGGDWFVFLLWVGSDCGKHWSFTVAGNLDSEQMPPGDIVTRGLPHGPFDSIQFSFQLISQELLFPPTNSILLKNVAIPPFCIGSWMMELCSDTDEKKKLLRMCGVGMGISIAARNTYGCHSTVTNGAEGNILMSIYGTTDQCKEIRTDIKEGKFLKSIESSCKQISETYGAEFSFYDILDLGSVRVPTDMESGIFQLLTEALHDLDTKKKILMLEASVKTVMDKKLFSQAIEHMERLLELQQDPLKRLDILCNIAKCILQRNSSESASQRVEEKLPYATVQQQMRDICCRSSIPWEDMEAIAIAYPIRDDPFYSIALLDCSIALHGHVESRIDSMEKYITLFFKAVSQEDAELEEGHLRDILTCSKMLLEMLKKHWATADQTLPVILPEVYQKNKTLIQQKLVEVRKITKEDLHAHLSELIDLYSLFEPDSSLKRKIPPVASGSICVDDISEDEDKLAKLTKTLREVVRQPVEKSERIGPKGGKIELCGCWVEFPDGSLYKHENITVTINTWMSDKPEGQRIITPVLKIKPSMKLKAPARISLQSFCSVDKLTPVNVVCKKKTQNKWAPFTRSVMGTDGIILFQVQHFCKFRVDEDEDGTPSPRRIINDVFVEKGTALIASAFCLHEKQRNQIIASFKSNGFVKKPPTGLQFRYNQLDKISTKIKCEVPENTTVKAIGGGRFEIDKDTDMDISFHTVYFAMKPRLSKEIETTLRMEYTVHKTDSEGKKKNAGTLPIHVEWPIEIQEEPRRRKIPKKSDNAGRYAVADEINAEDWPRFARETLGLTAAAFQRIKENYKTEEEVKFQTLLWWEKKKEADKEEADLEGAVSRFFGRS